MIRMQRTFIAILITLTQISFASADPNDAFQFFQEEAKVVTASRREQPINESPVAVDVITADDIRASGATNLADVFRFQPGMDVIDGRSSVGNREIVSIRGFAEAFARNVLVLVDNRPVYSAVTGGVYWDQLPVQLQDIERIEIIRGPNAALYGSGAGLGVINIITKKPTGNTSVALEQRGGNEDTIQSYGSVDSSIHRVDYHASYTYQKDDGFDNLPGGTESDFLSTHKANFRSHWSPAEGSDLELFAGGSWTKAGDPDALNSNNNFDEHFEMLKFSTKVLENSQIEILSSRNDYISNIAPDLVYSNNYVRNYEYDEQILQRIDWGNGRMNSTYGLDYQSTKANSPQTFTEVANVENNMGRLYWNQTVNVNRSLSLIGAVSEEARDTGVPETNYQLTSLWKVTHDQSLRASYSVAHTVPTLRLLDVNSNFVPGLLLTGNNSLKPQKVTSYETGYRGGWLKEHLQVEANAFYTVINDIDDSTVLSATPDVTTFGFINDNQAIARGTEMQLKYRFSPKRTVYVNYTYEYITDWIGNVGEVTKNTPPHTVNVGGSADLGRGFTGSINLGYKDSYHIETPTAAADAPAYWRLDARLAYAVPWYQDCEIYIAGQNLASSDHVEFADGLTVPRTYQGGITLKFGGIKK